MLQRIVLICLIALTLNGCSTVKGWFGGSKNTASEPAELKKMTNAIAVKQLWSTDIGKGERKLWLRQKPALSGNKVYVVDDHGRVIALDAMNGKSVWESKALEMKSSGSRLLFWRKHSTETGLTSSPGVGGGLVVVGGRNGEVIALDAETGSKKWAAKITSEVVSAPLVADDRVIVRSGDGRIFGFDVADGTRKWVFDRAMPTLSVRGNGSPVMGTGVIYAGYEDGTVVMLRTADGLQGWEQVVASPDGRTELDRAADIDGEIQVGGDAVFATSFHNESMALALNNGRPIWSRDIGSYGGLAMSESTIVVSDKQGVIHGLSRVDGSGTWKQEDLQRRMLTTPVIQGNYVVVGDLEGYLHWMKLDTGEIVARVRVQNAYLRGTPVISSEGVLYALTAEGELAAYKLDQ
ncbi:MAG TPA: outer membrane protein assembly factor BamB [Arenimonas sp.]|nr:outer membrane protein assembly factor BamB [Arenimonas sp.]HPW31750.1 outer membrane protein assembly factor BamB [Arenimonas sp.]